MLKKCSKCKTEKNLSEFYKKLKSKKYLRPTCISCCKEYKIRNRKALSKSDCEYQKKRRKEDPEYKLKRNLRDRLRKAVKNNQKVGSAVDGLGCSVEYFKDYIEKMFQPGMSWKNYGYRGWHIDHIKPLSSFNLLDKKELRKACHYTNLRPMWGLQNIKKGAKELSTEEKRWF